MRRPTTTHCAIGRIWPPRSRWCSLADSHHRPWSWGTSTTIHWRSPSSATRASAIRISWRRSSRTVVPVVILSSITLIIAPVASISFISVIVIILILVILLVVLLVVLLRGWPSRVLALWRRASCACAVEGSLGGVSCVICHLQGLVVLCVQLSQAVSLHLRRVLKAGGPSSTRPCLISFPSLRVVSTGGPARKLKSNVPAQARNYPMPSGCIRDEVYTQCAASRSRRRILDSSRPCPCLVVLVLSGCLRDWIDCRPRETIAFTAWVSLKCLSPAIGSWMRQSQRCCA